MRGIVERGFLIVFREWSQTRITLSRLSLIQVRVESDTFVEDKTFTVVVISAALLEVLEDSTIQLINITKARLLHKWSRFFAAYSSGAKHDNRTLFGLFWELLDRFGEIAKVVDANRTAFSNVPTFTS